MNYPATYEYMMNKLRRELSVHLTYHSAWHTQDVIDQCEVLAREEGIDNEGTLTLLKTAALFHDTGFLNVYSGHEKESCVIATEVLPAFGYSPYEIKLINGMIMATKIPQTPHTKLEEIIADADLDYLGRDDFPVISNYLKQELMHMGIVNDDYGWNMIQIKFLDSHHYFTPSAIKKRKARKEAVLQGLKQEMGLV